MEIIEAGITLGMPVMIMSWWVHSLLYRHNHLDREATFKQADQSIKEIRKSASKKQPATDDYWTNKWLKFGGGFYGLTALWTFIVLEMQGLWWMISHPSEIWDLLSRGIFSLVISFIQNQVMSLAEAFSWIVNWGNSGFSFIFFIAAYLGFYLGMKIAQQLDIVEAAKNLKKRMS